MPICGVDENDKQIFQRKQVPSKISDPRKYIDAKNYWTQSCFGIYPYAATADTYRYFLTCSPNIAITLSKVTPGSWQLDVKNWIVMHIMYGLGKLIVRILPGRLH